VEHAPVENDGEKGEQNGGEILHPIAFLIPYTLTVEQRSEVSVGFRIITAGRP
jgi:hypothetical protein